MHARHSARKADTKAPHITSCPATKLYSRRPANRQALDLDRILPDATITSCNTHANMDNINLEDEYLVEDEYLGHRRMCWFPGLVACVGTRLTTQDCTSLRRCGFERAHVVVKFALRRYRSATQAQLVPHRFSFGSTDWRRMLRLVNYLFLRTINYQVIVAFNAMR